MVTDGRISIDLAESFPHLNRAPIVEAVIDVRARASATWDEAAVTKRLKEALPEYPTIQSLRAFSLTAQFQPLQSTVEAIRPAATHDKGWAGLRFTSLDKLQIATFSREGFGFSRLQPYQDWKSFSKEAWRLWQAFESFAAVSEIQRLGVRCINKFDVPINNLQFGTYLTNMSESPAGLPNAGFLYHDNLAVPGYQYMINLVRTMQPPESPIHDTLALILDIDVYSTQPFPKQEDMIRHRWAEMHWLRNKMFFESITSTTVDLCQ